MRYLDTLDWDKLKIDLEKGIKQGVVALKKSAIVVTKKAGELSEEGHRQYKILSLKAKVHKRLSDLGARVYAVMGSRAKNPALDAQVKDIVAEIKKNQSEISSLEGTARRTTGRKIRKAASSRL